jgi:hypothetical protein
MNALSRNFRFQLTAAKTGFPFESLRKSLSPIEARHIDLCMAFPNFRAPRTRKQSDNGRACGPVLIAG